jgi:hypothetical protein
MHSLSTLPRLFLCYTRCPAHVVSWVRALDAVGRGKGGVREMVLLLRKILVVGGFFCAWRVFIGRVLRGFSHESYL